MLQCAMKTQRAFMYTLIDLTIIQNLKADDVKISIWVILFR